MEFGLRRVYFGFASEETGFYYSMFNNIIVSSQNKYFKLVYIINIVFVLLTEGQHRVPEGHAFVGVPRVEILTDSNSRSLPIIVEKKRSLPFTANREVGHFAIEVLLVCLSVIEYFNFGSYHEYE